MTIYTYDTEFLEDGETIALISIGIVCEDGREYYAVNSEMPYDRLKSDKWMCENVIPQLPLSGKVERHASGINYYWNLDLRSTLVKPKWVIANEVREFLLARPNGTGDGEWQPNPELWAYYAAYDHVALAQLWGKMISLPKGLPMWTHEIMQAIEDSGPDFQKPEQDGDEHNALADARWNMKTLRALGFR